MRRTWYKSPVRIHNSSAAEKAASSSSPYTNNFSCSTFKDIQNLCTNDSNSAPHPSRKPPIFHRVCAATSLVRSWSSRQLQSNYPPQFEPQPNANSTETSSRKILRTTSELQPLADSRETFETSEKTLTTSEPEPNSDFSEASEKILNTASEPEPKQDAESIDSLETSERTDTTTSAPSISLPGADKRIVIYFTSLRVVRSTFEDCRAVRSIIGGFPVSIDERDLSMDSGFLEELQGIMGETETKLTLPRVFIGGRYIGGAEETRQLHETGELKKFVEGLPAVEPGVCDSCGGYSFILCDQCNGSHKLYTEKNGFRSCTACNENGLIRCPSCSYAPFLAV